MTARLFTLHGLAVVLLVTLIACAPRQAQSTQTAMQGSVSEPTPAADVEDERTPSTQVDEQRVDARDDQSTSAADRVNGDQDDQSDEPTAVEPRTQPTTTSKSQPDTQPNVIRPIEGVVVQRDPRRVEIQAWTCLSEGWLEQVACSPGTREHESLVVIKVKPRNVHMALLLARFEAGRPGRWWVEDGEQQSEPPTGEKLDINVRYENENGESVTHSIRKWIADHREGYKFPDKPWVFGGSLFRKNPKWMGPGEHYVADQTGSLIGLVTFGDEVMGFSQVLADKVDVHPAQWEVNTETIPPVGTEVTVIITPYEQISATEHKDPQSQPLTQPAQRN